MHNQDSNLHSIMCLAHRIETIGNKYLFSPIGLSSSSAQILGMLSFHKSLTPTQILEMSNSTKSNISQRLSFLEKEGWIERDYGSNTKDKRKVDVVLTKQGQEKIKEIKKLMDKAKLSITKKFTRQELEQHIAFVSKMHKVLDSEEKELAKLLTKH